MAMVPSSASVRLKQPAAALFTKRKRVVFRVDAAKKVDSGRSLVLSSTLVVEAGKEEQVIRLCKGIVDWAKQRKQQLGRASGLVEFDCRADIHNKNVYHFWERYDSFDYMTETRGCPEHVKFMNEVRSLLERPIGLAAYEYKDGQLGHVRVLLGPKGEGGLDDATNQGKQTSRLMTGGDTVDHERDYWGLKEAIAAKSNNKKEWQQEFEQTKEALIARAKAKARELEEEKPILSEERRSVRDDSVETTPENQENSSLLNNIKSMLGLRK